MTTSSDASKATKYPRRAHAEAITKASTSTASTASPPRKPVIRRLRFAGGAAAGVTGISSVVWRVCVAASAASGSSPLTERGEVGELGGLAVGVVDRPRAHGRSVVPCRLEVELGVRVRWVVALDDVDDHHGDVVAAALAVGQGDELVGCRLRVADGAHDLDDVVVAHLVDEAVAAQQEAVAAHERQRPRVDAHRRVDAERSRHDVAPRVVARLVVGDVPGGDELLHVAVVDRDATQAAVAQQVGARVADVDEGELLLRRLGAAVALPARSRRSRRAP